MKVIRKAINGPYFYFPLFSILIFFLRYTKKAVVEDEEELVNIFDTKWYKEISSSTTPGEAMRIYRENFGLSQTELGKKLGKFTRQKISDIENGKRNISKEVAKRLSRIFDVPVDRFI